jgi:hypothetical protein
LGDCKLAKAPRRNGIAIWREQEINCVAGGIDRSVQVHPFASNADEGFVDTP